MTTLDLVVTAAVEPVPGIRSLTLAAGDGGDLPGFVPGSHLLVECGGRTNAYSLTSDGTAPSSYAVSVLELPDGSGGSRWLHGGLAVGDTLTVHAPRSLFAPVAAATKHLLIAGGIGVTPIVSHLRAARTWGRATEVHYVFREGRGAHVDDVLALTDDAAELHTDRAAFCARLADVLADQPLGTHLYVCGPAAMIDHVLETARGLGWPESRLHAERFGTDVLDPGDPFDLILTASGATITVPSGTSVLEVLEAHGVEVPHLCRQGVCGECRIPVTAGTPLHRDVVLTDEDRAAGNVLMACVSRCAGPTLEVPL